MKKFFAFVLAVLMAASLSVVGTAAVVPVRFIRFNHDIVWLRIGGSRTILPEVVPGNAAMPELEWSSSDESVATVDSTGKVTGLSAGHTKITAATADGEHSSFYFLEVRGEDSPVMQLQGVNPGGKLKNSVSINSEDQAGDFFYQSVEEVRSAAFKEGKMAVTQYPGDILKIKPAVLKQELADVGTTLEDTLEVILADGTKCEFLIELKFNSDPYLKFVEIKGHPKRFHGEVGVTYPYVFEMVDKANFIKEISEVEVHITEEPYVPDAPPIVEVGETEIHGKQVVVPLTPVKNGDAYITVFFAYIRNIGVERDSFNWHMDIGSSSASSGAGSDDTEPSATDNAVNSDETIQAIAYGDEKLELKVTNGAAGIAVTTVDTLGNYHTTLTIQNDKMTVSIPGGFGKVNEPGRIYYPMDFSDNLANAADLAAPVKGDGAKTEVVKAGGDMVMPTTVTVTLKTKLTGTVNVYYYNPETRRYTLLASPTAKDGTITFATKQMGTMVLTTGTI